MKKIFRPIILTLALILLVSSFIGCDNSEKEDDIGTVIYALSKESISLPVKEKDTSCYIYVDGEKKGTTFAIKSQELFLPKFVFSSYKGKIVTLKVEILDENKAVKSVKEFTINVVDRVISSVKEFNDWYSGYEKLHDDNEYVILTEDINLNGNVINNSTMAGWLKTMYKGTFDGRGHVVYNFASVYGFIPNIGKDGCIKNVAFVNMETTGYNGFLGQWLCGTIENCYFEGKQTNLEGGVRFTGFYSRYYDDQGNNGYAKVCKNVVVKVNRTDVGVSNDAFCDKYLIGVPKSSTFSNVYMVNNNFNGIFLNQTWDGLDVNVYNSNLDFKRAVTELPEGFSSELWEIGLDGTLCFKSVK